jgi:hypothetical protein
MQGKGSVDEAPVGYGLWARRFPFGMRNGSLVVDMFVTVRWFFYMKAGDENNISRMKEGFLNEFRDDEKRVVSPLIGLFQVRYRFYLFLFPFSVTPTHLPVRYAT